MRPPSTSTLTANACQALYAGRQPSLAGGGLGELRPRGRCRRARARPGRRSSRASAPAGTRERRSWSGTARSTSSRRPRRRSRRRRTGTSVSSLRFVCTSAFSFAASIPGSLNASPRSAVSISASEREARCSAQPYGYSIEIAGAFGEPDELPWRTARRADRRNHGTTSCGNSQRLLRRGGIASPYAATVSGDDQHAHRDDVFECIALSSHRHASSDAGLADGLRLGVEPDFSGVLRLDLDGRLCRPRRGWPGRATRSRRWPCRPA